MTIETIIGRGWVFPPRLDAQGRIALTTERNEIEQAIQIILMTAPGQRVMRPTFGCRLHELIFLPNNTQTAALARRYVEEALGMWEPRIIIHEISARPATIDDIAGRPDPNHESSGRPDRDDRCCLLIEIQYEVKSTHDRRSLVHPFYLIPGE